MEYFRSLSSALGKSGGPLSNYKIDREIDSYHGNSIWTLYDGVRRVRTWKLTLVGFSACQCLPF